MIEQIGRGKLYKKNSFFFFNSRLKISFLLGREILLLLQPRCEFPEGGDDSGVPHGKVAAGERGVGAGDSGMI